MENSITRPRARRWFKEALMSSWGIKKDQDGTLDAAARIPNWNFRQVLQSIYHAAGTLALFFALFRGVPIAIESFVPIFTSDRMKGFWVEVIREAMAPPEEESQVVIPPPAKKPVKRNTSGKPLIMKQPGSNVRTADQQDEQGALIAEPRLPLSSARIANLGKKETNHVP